jgi:hypothetical protein
MNILVCYVMHLDNQGNRVEGHGFRIVERLDQECLAEMAVELRAELLAEKKIKSTIASLILRSVTPLAG